MPSGLGLRVALLAAALVAVAVVAVLADWSTWTIIAVMAVSFLIVSAIEIVASQREGGKTSEDAPDEALAVPDEPPVHVRVLDEEQVREPEAEIEREPPPEPERPPLVTVPPPPVPERKPAARREPEPPPEVVPIAVRTAMPREWNLWELEQASRRASGDDPLRDEERNYLLMYLREFANAEGTLPADFDALVRDSFADVIPAG